MELGDHTHPAGDQLSDLELALFTLAILLVSVSIFTIVHFRGTTADVFAIGSFIVAAVAGATTAHTSAPKGGRRRAVPDRRRTDYRRGDYRATSDELFRVEQVDEARAVVENCRTGELVEVGFDELDALRPVLVSPSAPRP
jgi:hypothetical protein